MASNAPDVAPVLTHAETAKILRVTIRTVRTWAKAGDLRAVRLGPGAVRFAQADVAEFIAARRTPARQEGGAGR